MKNLYNNHDDELLARGGTFDITGTDAVTDKQFWAFNASEGAVIDTIKGIPIHGSAFTLEEIEDTEVDISGIFLTSKTDPLFGGILYRAAGYIITNIKLTSGSLHCFMLVNQVSA